MINEVEDGAENPEVESEVYNSSDPAHIAKAEKKSVKKKANRLRVISAIMEHADGRKWMYGLLERCHIFGNPFCPGQSDSTAFNLGEANIGRLIMADVLAACPESYTLMCVEGKDGKQ